MKKRWRGLSNDPRDRQAQALSVTGRIQTIFKDVSDRIPAAKTANPKEFMDTSLLEELDRSGYIDGLYR